MLAIFTALLALAPTQPTTNTRYEQVMISRNNVVPGVDLATFTLITDNVTADRRDADSIMEVKAAWPLAMRTKDERLFKRILSNGFTFLAHGRIYEKDAYIRDRMTREEAVQSARYDNVVLQIFGSMALLTYNVRLVTERSGTDQTWRGTWADVFVRDKGRWQVTASRLISEEGG